MKTEFRFTLIVGPLTIDRMTASEAGAAIRVLAAALAMQAAGAEGESKEIAEHPDGQ